MSNNMILNSKCFSVRNFYFEFNFVRCKVMKLRFLYLCFERKYQENEVNFISKRSLMLVHQIKDCRNRLSIHNRKQFLKKNDYGE